MSVYSSLRGLCRKVLFVLLIVLPISVTADVYFMESGKISSINNKRINTGDLFYKFLPTVKVKLRSGKKGTISKLKVGDDVNMKILHLDGKSYVDTIIQLPVQSSRGNSNTEENN